MQLYMKPNSRSGLTIQVNRGYSNDAYDKNLLDYSKRTLCKFKEEFARGKCDDLWNGSTVRSYSWEVEPNWSYLRDSSAELRKCLQQIRSKVEIWNSESQLKFQAKSCTASIWINTWFIFGVLCFDIDVFWDHTDCFRTDDASSFHYGAQYCHRY